MRHVLLLSLKTFPLALPPTTPHGCTTARYVTDARILHQSTNPQHDTVRIALGHVLCPPPWETILHSGRGGDAAESPGEPASLLPGSCHLRSQRPVRLILLTCPAPLCRPQPRMDANSIRRYTPQFGGYNTAVRYGHDYARRARQEIDIDEPSIEALQALMLLSQASFQMGKGKKTYMLLSTAFPHHSRAHLFDSPVQSLTASNYSFRHFHGICPRSTSRASSCSQGFARRARRSPTPLLVLLSHG